MEIRKQHDKQQAVAIGEHHCYHCGEENSDSFMVDDKYFCCQGCKQVYLLLSDSNLCQYYQLVAHPGLTAMGKFTGARFAYLDDESVIHQLALFRDDSQINVLFSLPQMHCSSCVFLLEKLHQINPGILQSRVNFQQRNLFVSFNPTMVSLRQVVELLAFLGYEPTISLQDSIKKEEKRVNRRELIQLGIAGFCFSNIMMLSFPEYFSGGNIETVLLQQTFSGLILALSLPVLLYSAFPFFASAFKGLRQKEMNIDLPISLAILITFFRSYYEIVLHQGAGYLDSGTGIIFFMLVGRWFQHKTYDALSFDRKYQSYFPLGATIQKNQQEQSVPITSLSVDDTVVVRNNEMIPADGILIEGEANIDYSFVTGEKVALSKQLGSYLYAGGKQIGTSIIVKIVKKPSQSYITELWNNSVFNKNKETKTSFIHPWSRYFTGVLLSVALLATIYWYFADSSKIFTVLTSVLIVACPCSLLLSSSFTFGNMLRIIGKSKLFLKNATVIESMSQIDHIVFDKTGTLTGQERAVVSYKGVPLSDNEHSLLRSMTAHSSHVLSRSVHQFIPGMNVQQPNHFISFQEVQGAGICAATDNMELRIGNAQLVKPSQPMTQNNGSEVHVSINDRYKGYFEVIHSYREGMEEAVQQLKEKYTLHVLSGDNDAEKAVIQNLFGTQTSIHFMVSPQQKLDYIKGLQTAGHSVMMIGDGLNDAGALMQANVGIAVTEKNAHFTPACDGIIEGSAVQSLPALMKYATLSKRNVSVGFALSILYNIVGLSFAVQGKLAPVVAAILMPISSISIVMVAAITAYITALQLRLTR